MPVAVSGRGFIFLAGWILKKAHIYAFLIKGRSACKAIISCFNSFIPMIIMQFRVTTQKPFSLFSPLTYHHPWIMKNYWFLNRPMCVNTFFIDIHYIGKEELIYIFFKLIRQGGTEG